MGQSIKAFIASRKPRWDRLEVLLQALASGTPGKLKASDILDIGRLYREATADLARLQAFRKEGSAPEDLEIYLNQLVARSYGQIYRRPSSGWRSLWGFLRFTVPATFRKTAPWTILALAIFMAGLLYGFVATLTDDGFIPLIVPAKLIRQVEDRKVWFDSILAVAPQASSRIMTNNISVTFLAFAFGMTFGLGTFYIMVFNGMLLGALAGLCHINGLDAAFWSFVLPHGVIELTAIFMGGGAGFLLSAALLMPGDLTRKSALILRGRQAVGLTLGCVPLLTVAGVVEGFFSPLPLPVELKFLVAGILLALLLGYLLFPLTTIAPYASHPYNASASRWTGSQGEGP